MFSIFWSSPFFYHRILFDTEFAYIQIYTILSTSTNLMFMLMFAYSYKNSSFSLLFFVFLTSRFTSEQVLLWCNPLVWPNRTSLDVLISYHVFICFCNNFQDRMNFYQITENCFCPFFLLMFPESLSTFISRNCSNFSIQKLCL